MQREAGPAGRLVGGRVVGVVPALSIRFFFFGKVAVVFFVLATVVAVVNVVEAKKNECFSFFASRKQKSTPFLPVHRRVRPPSRYNLLRSLPHRKETTIAVVICRRNPLHRHRCRQCRRQNRRRRRRSTTKARRHSDVGVGHRRLPLVGAVVDGQDRHLLLRCCCRCRCNHLLHLTEKTFRTKPTEHAKKKKKKKQQLLLAAVAKKKTSSFFFLRFSFLCFLFPCIFFFFYKKKTSHSFFRFFFVHSLPSPPLTFRSVYTC